jgi:phosphatidylserine/phosphatidylglycerophosphate/cardiolipin synthase-like enzyme
VNAFKKIVSMRVVQYCSSLFFILILFVFLIYKAVTPELPSSSSPLIFYANQSRQDLKLTLCKAIDQAQTSLFACFYGLTDRDIISALARKASLGVDVAIEYDRTASRSLKEYFPSTASLKARRSKGLMHRKILIVDHAYLFLGSANLTLSSLRHHSNCMIGLYAPPLAQFLSQSDANQFFFSLDAQRAEMWLLPDTEQLALHRLLALIEGASKTIRIAMFTLTHPQIAQALNRAVKRGVRVSIIVDYYSARGASKKTVELLKKAGAEIYLSQGPQLLHHKWAIIDQDTFAMGSANWTKAAFTKNEEFLFILSSLTRSQKKYLDDLWEILELEANTFV